jgi:hypothetical protein
MDMFTSAESCDPDLSSKQQWTEVPEAIRKEVEQYVSASLPAEVLAKLRDLHDRGILISSGFPFFHFGGGPSCPEPLQRAVLYRRVRCDRCFAGPTRAMNVVGAEKRQQDGDSCS